MINIWNGNLKIDEHELVIDPDLSALKFKAGGIPILSTRESKDWITFFFNASIEGMLAEFVICFCGDKLHILGWVPKYGKNREEWVAISSDQQKQYLDGWLLKHIGPSPYEYPWGEINADKDMKSGDYGIVVLYQREIQARKRELFGR
jgi:hypothetical protein